MGKLECFHFHSFHSDLTTYLILYFSKAEEQNYDQKQKETYLIGIQKTERTREIDVETGNQSSK